MDSSGAQGNGGSGWSSISADGRFVVFTSSSTNLVAADTNARYDVFVHDRVTHVTECESVDPAGATGNGDSPHYWDVPTISSDGRYVLFDSDATNLLGGTLSSGQLYLRDRSTATTEVVSLSSSGAVGNGVSEYGTISQDGSLVAFSSLADNLVGSDTNQFEDLFLRDRVAGTTTRISVGTAGHQSNGPSQRPRITPDGQFVVFSSWATNLVSGDTNGTWDIFVYDVQAGSIERVSVDSSGAEGNGRSEAGSISADGRYVVFASDATNLVSGDTNNRDDVFVHDRTTGATERISVDSSGGQANGNSVLSSISDGRFVAFQSIATNLVAGDTNGRGDIFVRDRTSGTTTRVSVDSNGNETDQESQVPRISADGAVVSFKSFATNLVSGDTNGLPDIFVSDGDFAAWTNYGAGFPGTNGVPTFTSSGDPTLGTTIALDLANSCGQPTVGVVFAGVQRATIHTNRGGDLLLLPLLAIPVTFSYGGNQYFWSIPADGSLAGLTIDLQAVEADAGAAMGVSFTPGLELAVGF